MGIALLAIIIASTASETAHKVVLKSENVVLHQRMPTLFECGPKAAYLLLKLEGRDVRYSDVLAAAPGCGADGTSIAGVKSLLDQFGASSRILRCRREELQRLTPPFILFTYPQREIGHFVVVFANNKDELQVIDANNGKEKKYAINRITNIWDGIVIVPQQRNQVGKLLAATFALLVAIWYVAFVRRVPSVEQRELI